MRSIHVRSLAVAASVVALTAASSARANFPTTTVQWELDGNLVYDDTSPGLPNGAGFFRYMGAHSTGGVSMSYSLLNLPHRRISSAFDLENTSANTVEIQLLVTMPVTSAIAAPTSLTGSVSGGMTADADGGLVEELPGIAFWQALIDGTAVGGVTDLLAGLSVSALPAESVSLGSGGFAGVVGPAVANDIGILVSFSLSAGEQLSFTSVFDVVPSPGGLAVLGLAFVLSRRRRRAC